MKVLIRNPYWLAAIVVVPALALLGIGCSSSAAGVAGSAGGGDGSLDGSAGGQTGAGGGAGPDGSTLGVEAGGKLPIGHTQCSDGIDNDHDGRIDYGDPECVGPNDNDEGSYATGIPGDNVDACKQDCFFDGNSGMGDDHCLWQLKCDPLSQGSSCPYDPSYASQHASECSLSASQSQSCIDNCRKLVPNGCDCFGCCMIPGAPNAIRLAATCTAAKFNDPIACPPCTQVTQCANPCERCEICIGKPTLPADCAPAGTDAGSTPPPPVCPASSQACGPGGIDPAACPAGTGCITGCCQTIVP